MFDQLNKNDCRHSLSIGAFAGPKGAIIFQRIYFRSKLWPSKIVRMLRKRSCQIIFVLVILPFKWHMNTEPNLAKIKGYGYALAEGPCMYANMSAAKYSECMFALWKNSQDSQHLIENMHSLELLSFFFYLKQTYCFVIHKIVSVEWRPYIFHQKVCENVHIESHTKFGIHIRTARKRQ